jgi:hypothetical protein
MKIASNTVLSVVVGCLSLAFVSCDSYTTHSLCSGATGPIEGITGSYEVSFRQSETFGITTTTFDIMPDDKGRAYRVQSEDNNSSLLICNVAGQYLFEHFDDVTQLYSQGRLYIGQMGLLFQPLMYDKLKLDGAGIPNKISVIPDKFRGLLGDVWSSRADRVVSSILAMLGQDDQAVLVVDNSNAKPGDLLQHAKPSVIGFTAVRR